MSGNILLEKFPNSENAYGIRDAAFAHRWLDLWGDIQKVVINGPVATDDTTAVPTIFTSTATGTSPLTVSATPGEAFLFTTGGTEYDGINAQVKGTQFELATGKPAYFGIKCTLSDATQSDFLVGLCGIDTTLTAASSSHALAIGAGGVFFSKLDGVTTSYFKAYATTSETGSATAGTMDTSAHVYEIYWDGYTLTGYIDGVAVGSFTSGLPTVALTPSVVVRAGAAAAKTLKVNWLRAFQVRG